MRLPTASRLDLFWACSGPWHLPLNEPEPTSKAAERGKTIHAQVETGDTSTADAQRAARAMADLPPSFALADVPQHEVVVFYDLDERLAGILGSIHDHPRESWQRRDRRIYGIADYVGRTSGHLLVADLKTGAVEWLKMPWEELQTRFLSSVVSAALDWGKGVYACIASSEAERAWCQEWTRTELSDWLKQLSERVSLEEKVSGLPKLNPGEHCTFCTVRKACPLYAFPS